MAVLPVVVHAADDGAYLQSGMADMLSSRLGRQDGVGVIRVTDPAAATTEVVAAQEAGRSVGAEYVLFGSFTRFGEGASLDVRVVPVAGDGNADAERAIFIQSGTIGEIIPRLDGLTERVARFVTSGGREGLPDVASGTTSAAAPAAADLRGELEALRARVQVLEEQLNGAGEAVPEVDLRPN